MRGGTAAHAAALFVLLLHLGALGKVGAFRAVTLDLYAGDRTCSKVDQRKRVLLDTCHKAAHLGLAGGKDTLAMIVAAAGHPGVNASSWTSAAAVEAWLFGMEVMLTDQDSRPDAWEDVPPPDGGGRRGEESWNLTVSWYPPDSLCNTPSRFAVYNLLVEGRLADEPSWMLFGNAPSESCYALLPDAAAHTPLIPLSEAVLNPTDQVFAQPGAVRRLAFVDTAKSGHEWLRDWVLPWEQNGARAKGYNLQLGWPPSAAALIGKPGLLDSPRPLASFSFFSFCFDGSIARQLGDTDLPKRGFDNVTKRYIIDVYHEACDAMYHPYRAAIRRSHRIGPSDPPSVSDAGWMGDERTGWLTYVRVAREVPLEVHAVAVETVAFSTLDCSGNSIAIARSPGGRSCSALHGGGALAQWWTTQGAVDSGSGRTAMPSTALSYLGYERVCSRAVDDTLEFDVYHDGNCEASSYAPLTQVTLNVSRECIIGTAYHPALIRLYDQIGTLPFGGLSEWSLRHFNTAPSGDVGEESAGPGLAFTQRCVDDSAARAPRTPRRESFALDVSAERSSVAAGAPSCGYGEYVSYSTSPVFALSFGNSTSATGSDGSGPAVAQNTTQLYERTSAVCRRCSSGYACRGAGVRIDIQDDQHSSSHGHPATSVALAGVYLQSSAVCNGGHVYNRNRAMKMVRLANSEIDSPSVFESGDPTYMWFLGELGNTIAESCSLLAANTQTRLNKIPVLFVAFTDRTVPIDVDVATNFSGWHRWVNVNNCARIGSSGVPQFPSSFLFNENRLELTAADKAKCWGDMAPRSRLITTQIVATAEECANGMYAPSAGAAMCSMCPAGRYSTRSVGGAKECRVCPIGHKCDPNRFVRLTRAGHADRIFRTTGEICGSAELMYETNLPAGTFGDERIHHFLAAYLDSGTAEPRRYWAVTNASEFCLLARRIDATNEVLTVEVDPACLAAGGSAWPLSARADANSSGAVSTGVSLQPACTWASSIEGQVSFKNRVELFTMESNADVAALIPNDAVWWSPGKTLWTNPPHVAGALCTAPFTPSDCSFDAEDSALAGDVEIGVDMQRMMLPCVDPLAVCASEGASTETLVTDGAYRIDASTSVACEAGFFCSKGVRQPCRSGWYAAAQSSAACYRCEEDTFAVVDATHGSPRCAACPATGAKCGGMETLGASLLPGFWFDAGANSSALGGMLLTSDTRLYDCGDDAALCGSTRSANATAPRFAVVCGGGRVGVKCQLCPSDAVRTKAGCATCGASTQRYGVFIIVAVLATLLVLVALVTTVLALRPMKPARLDAKLFPIVVAHIYGRRWRAATAARKRAAEGAVRGVPGANLDALDRAVAPVRGTDGKRRSEGGVQMQGATGALELNSVSELTRAESAAERTLALSATTAGEGVRNGATALRSAVSGSGGGGGSCSWCTAEAFARSVSCATRCVSGSMLKTLLVNIQITASVPHVFNAAWPPVFTALLSTLAVALLDVATIVSDVVPCAGATHYQSLVVLLLLPLLCFCAALPVYGAVAVAACVRRRQRSVGVGDEAGTRPLTQKRGGGASAMARRSKWRCTLESVARANIIKFNLLVTMILFPAICNRIFITFKCEEVGGVYYLEADWRKRCFVDEEWWFYAALAGAGALVYIVGLPITITLALLHHHKRSRLRYPRLGALTPASIAASVIESEKHFRVRLKYGDL